MIDKKDVEALVIDPPPVYPFLPEPPLSPFEKRMQMSLKEWRKSSLTKREQSKRKKKNKAAKVARRKGRK